MKVRQSITEFYVCVRLRETDTLEARLPPSTGSYDGFDVIPALAAAVEKYGNAYKVTIEPVEYRSDG